MLVMAVAQTPLAEQALTVSTKRAVAAVLDGAAAQLDKQRVTVDLASSLFDTSQTQRQAIVHHQLSVAQQPTVKRSLVHVEHGVATPRLLTHISGSALLVQLVITQTFQVQLH